MRRQLQQIQCSVCSSDHHTAQSNTTHCNTCRAHRDMTFIGSRTKDCFACKTKFAPVNRNDELCSNCDYNHKVYGRGTCGVCKKADQTLMRHDIAICISCMRDPAKRSDLIMKLRNKQKWLIKNPVRLEPPPILPPPPVDDIPEV